MRAQPVILIAMSLAALTGCNRNEHAVMKVERQLTVVGQREGVERFVGLQGSRRPALAVTAIRAVGDGRVAAIVTLPASFSGQDLVHTTREALAADLRYKFEERRWVSTNQS